MGKHLFRAVGAALLVCAMVTPAWAQSGDAEAEEKFKEISEAYATLSNAEQRKEYDQIRAMGSGAPRFTAGDQPGDVLAWQTGIVAEEGYNFWNILCPWLLSAELPIPERVGVIACWQEIMAIAKHKQENPDDVLVPIALK